MPPAYFFLETLVRRFDKHIRGPSTCSRPIQPVIVHGGLRRFHLFQRHALLNHILNAVAHDGHHVPVVGHVAGIAQAPVAGNDHGAALRAELRNRQIQNAIQTVQNAVDAAALVHFDHGIAIRAQDIAGADHIGVAEEHDAIAVGVRIRQVENLHAFAVEKLAELVGRRAERLGRPESVRHRSLACHAGLAHAMENVLMRDDLGCGRHAHGRKRNADDLRFGGQLGEPFVPAGVIRIDAGIDNETNRLGRRGRADDRS